MNAALWHDAQNIEDLEEGMDIQDDRDYWERQFNAKYAECVMLRQALKDALPWLERGEKFYKFQRPGREFYPNREEAEGITVQVRKALDAEARP